MCIYRYKNLLELYIKELFKIIEFGYFKIGK